MSATATSPGSEAITETAANSEAVRRMIDSDPVLVGVAPAIDVVPDMRTNLILTSGAPQPWSAYTGGQRDAIIGAALFEGLAVDRDEAIKLLDSGDIQVDGCHSHSCVGSLAGVYSASMPVFIVENRAFGNRAYCSFYEGNERKRLNYGVYDADVHARLVHLNNVIAPALQRALARAGDVPLRPIMKAALQMGDELHSRNTAATLLFSRVLMPSFLSMSADGDQDVAELVQSLDGNDYFFLRLGMAAAKATADAADGIEGSSVVTAMAFSNTGFSIRVSGLPGQWFRGPHANIHATLFDGHTEEEISWMGGESPITETVGLGGFAQSSAPALQRYQGGTPEVMVKRNLSMYDITVGEHPHLLLPYLGYRGAPIGIDIRKVLATGTLPIMDVGIAGRDGGQIGAGVITAPIECFRLAAQALEEAS